MMNVQEHKRTGISSLQFSMVNEVFPFKNNVKFYRITHTRDNIIKFVYKA